MDILALAALAKAMQGGGGGSAENAVLYTEQSLAASEMAQARTNIGAGQEPLVVTYTVTGATTATSDKTFNELYAAMQAKRPIIGCLVSSGTVAAEITSVALESITGAGTWLLFAMEGTSGTAHLRHHADGTVSLRFPPTLERTVSTDGASTYTLDAGVIFHFTGALTSLTISLKAPGIDDKYAQYHFDFTAGSTAPTLVMPSTVVMPDGFTVEADTHYEIDILNNYAVVMSWAVSA